MLAWLLGAALAQAGNVNAILAINSYTNITAASTTVIKSSPGLLGAVCVNTPVNNATLILFDNTTNSGTKIATQTTLVGAINNSVWAPQCQAIGHVKFNTGLTAVVTGTADWTIYWQ